ALAAGIFVRTSDTVVTITGLSGLVGTDNTVLVKAATQSAQASSVAAVASGIVIPTAAPTISSVSPSSGPAAGGTSVTITGTNLTGTTSVTFGGTAGTSVTAVNATTVTVATPAGVAGTVNVVLTTTDGSVTSTGGFTYVTPAVPSETEAVKSVLSPLVDNKIDVQIQGTSTTANLNISINIPKNSLTEETTVSVFSNSQVADIDAGFVSVRIESNRTSDNSAVTTFANAIEIRIPTNAIGASPAWSRDGLTWTLLPRLLAAVLPEGQPDGYFVNADGSYSFFTRHLTTFGLMRTQVPLTLTSSNSGLKVHETVQLSYSGGTGSGAMMFKSKNPTVCAVSSGGIVSGLSVGECSVTVSKLGSGSYLDATSAPTIYSITEFALTNTFEGSTITIKRSAGRTTIKVSMPKKYANKLIRLEWGVMKKGSVFYGSWGNTRANSSGVATLSTSKIITLKTIMRATLNSRVIAKRGIFQN
ncbi:MAG: IPT/TIG domain-containing protein, partial [Ilumatobacteraceae bacterium]